MRQKTDSGTWCHVSHWTANLKCFRMLRGPDWTGAGASAASLLTSLYWGLWTYHESPTLAPPPTHVASKVSAADRRDRAVCTLFRTPISFKPSDFIRRLPFLKKLRRNLHNVKLTILNVRFSGIWCTRVLCNHQLHLVPKHFCHPKKRACPLSTHRPTPPLDPGTHCPTLSPWTCRPWTGHLSGITTAWPLVSGFSR